MHNVLHFRVKKSALEQFALLAINSANDSRSKQLSSYGDSASSSQEQVITLDEFERQLASTNTAVSDATSLPPALVSLITAHLTHTTLTVAHSFGAFATIDMQTQTVRDRYNVSHTAHVSAMRHFNGDELILTGGFDGNLYLTQHRSNTSTYTTVASNNISRQIHCIQPLMYAATASLSPTLAVCVSASQGHLAIYNLPSLHMLTSYTGSTNAVSCVMSLRLDNRLLLVSGSWDGTCRVWDANTSECLLICSAGKTLDGVISLVAYDHTIIAGLLGGNIKLWSLQTLTLQSPLKPSDTTNGTSSIRSISVSGGRSSHRIFESPSYQEQQSSYSTRSLEPATVAMAHASGVNCMAIHRRHYSGQIITLTGGVDGFVRLWTAGTSSLRCIGVIRDPTDSGGCMSMQVIDHECYVGMTHSTVNVWSLHNIDVDGDVHDMIAPTAVVSLLYKIHDSALRSIRCLEVIKHIDIAQDTITTTKHNDDNIGELLTN